MQKNVRIFMKQGQNIFAFVISVFVCVMLSHCVCLVFFGFFF